MMRNRHPRARCIPPRSRQRGFIVNPYASSSALVYPGFIGSRAVIGGGVQTTPSFTNVNILDYWDIAGSPANAVDFGDLTVVRGHLAAASDGTRGVYVGGQNNTPTAQSTMDRITIASTGNAASLGALTQARTKISACGNTTRGLAAGGDNGVSTFYNIIDYWNPAASPTHNATDFGDISSNRSNITASASDTRAVFVGGSTQIEYVTISTPGNYTTFGTLGTARTSSASASDGFTMVIMGHDAGPSNAHAATADKLTIATTSNGSSWGSLVSYRALGAGVCNGPRIMWAGGVIPGVAGINVIEYAAMTDATMVDFGDLTSTRYQPGGLSGT